jgi:hypothetical protein
VLLIGALGCGTVSERATMAARAGDLTAEARLGAVAATVAGGNGGAASRAEAAQTVTPTPSLTSSIIEVAVTATWQTPSIIEIGTAAN